MPTTNERYRDAARRAHRQLAAYLVNSAWVHDVDCVVIDRRNLFRYLGLQSRMDRTRLGWLTADTKIVFPHTQVLYSSGAGQQFSCIYLSRRPFPGGFPSDRMHDSTRIEKLTAAGLKAAIIEFGHESVVLERMAKLVLGLSDFGEFDWDYDLTQRSGRST